MNKYDTIIIGGGASGLMCALTAGQRKRHVLVIESTAKVGKKILMSGGGRCNFTNLFVESESYLSANPHFCKSALKGYTQWDFIALVEQYKITYHERKHGELFCDNSARDILDMLLAECREAGVDIKTRCEVESIQHDGDFRLTTSLGSFTSESLVVATGGLSIPTMGSSGFGYDIASQFGMDVLPTRAGLVPFMFSDWFKAVSERLSGIAIEVTLDNISHAFTENILFTHRGLSGPAVLQLSSYWHPGEPVYIDLLPTVDVESLLVESKGSQPKILLRTLLSRQLPKKLVMELESLMWPEWSEKAVTEIPDKMLRSIARQLGRWELKPSGTEGYRTAEVTLGGVNTDQLSSKTMESKTQAGLYFIGEVVDVTGHLGGFNFQWAWSSGYAAGQHV